MELTSGMLLGARFAETYGETVWVIDTARAGMTRDPVPGSSDPTVSPMEYRGPLVHAIYLLQTSVETEEAA